MDISFKTIIEDPKAQELTAKIMSEIGLGGPPESYDGDGASAARIAAADRLEAALRAHADEIARPDPEIINPVKTTARKFEVNPKSLRLTYEVARTAIYGHIWLHRVRLEKFLVITAKAGVLSLIRGLISDELLRKNRRRFPSEGGCGDDDCGGCGGCGGGCGGHP